MGFDTKKEAQRKAVTRQRIIETGFHVFAERTIDGVNLTDVAKAAGLGAATVYRYYNSKPPLVLDVGTWVWKEYITGIELQYASKETTAAEKFEIYLDSFIDLYRNHRDILRFNQFFNVFVQRESITAEQMEPYNGMIQTLEQRFHELYARALEDGTLRTDISANEIFSSTLHLMLAAVTRYAVGLVYDCGVDPEQELLFLKRMLMGAYAKRRDEHE